jgi:hypothetical protein
MHSLRLDQIEMIAEALAAAGDYGVVSLVVEKGRLRFVRVERSLDVNKYEPGHLARG